MAEKWEVEGSIYESFAATIYVAERERGKQYIAQVREYSDALEIVRDHEAQTAELAALVEAAMAFGKPNERGLLDPFGDWRKPP